MTQEEVDLIYDYLHENYEYKDGELIRIKNSRGKKIGESFGYFYFKENKEPRVIGSIWINKKKYTLRLSIAIFLFFKKIKPRYLNYLDGNPTNTHIENLENVPAKKIIRKGFDKSRKYKTYITKKGLKRFYVLLNINGTSRGLVAVDEESYAIKLHKKATYLYLENGLSFDQIKYSLKEEILNKKSIRFNKYGYPFISKSGKKYHGVYHVNGKSKYTKAYESPKDAHEACLKAKMELNKS